MQGEGEGTLIPPLVPEIVQTNTDVILGSSPDPGGDDGQSRTPPPLSGNNNQDCDLQVKVPEADQGEAEQAPVPKSTGNDPTISGAQVRGMDTTPGATATPPVSHWQYVGLSLEWITGPPQESSRGPTYNPEKTSVF